MVTFAQGHSVIQTEVQSRSAQLQSPHIIFHHYPHRFSQDPLRHNSPVLKENSSLPGFSKGHICFLTEDYLHPVDDQKG